ncbi:hypothetical protein CPB83DRAFT_854337 [Crepidotus variabilis]|uniref:Uncharacterized protein n=1 Tax=Crepidotus variabilis TaxID=179855 RepID=A0A9P6EGB7_9AGAR|nr:hypothetical protein CPB83DRAFT_854337 [Crepidotus variabilis]
MQYNGIKAQYPGEGRRKWCLRVLYESWPTITSEVQPPDFGTSIVPDDPDPQDGLLEDEELGLIIRTDFTNDTAWSNFYNKVLETQKELVSDLKAGASGSADDSVDTKADVAMNDVSQTTDDNSKSGSDCESAPDIVKFLYPQDPETRQQLTNLSNLKALRLYNDVGIRTAPTRPEGTKPISPSNPLIDQNGWQEIYSGKNIWIYDSRSNTDECVRVVAQKSDFYGTATGDSWRARGTYVCELQFSMAYQGMNISFNGMDGWDHAERSRNLREALEL